MNLLLARSELNDLHRKVEAGERLSRADGERLFAARDLHALAAMAGAANERLNGNRASYIVNRYLNYSNYCILSCQFCAFARKKRNGD
ncbi:MAG: aminofutalosine synthase MqnE, partial [Verrucomicrobiae bacterium]|nr:aminofutalosine synthase MqnE [Verrucomicrobiae bacterium]